MKNKKLPRGQDGFYCAWLCFEFQLFSWEINAGDDSRKQAIGHW